jgi:hypothetical protein
MKTYIIDPKTKSITPQDFDGQLNSIYTLFNSILIDSSQALNRHIIYSDEYATDNGCVPYFIGDKLFLGKALVCSENVDDGEDVSITAKELEQIINYDVNEFYLECLSYLSKEKISINKIFHIQDKDEKIKLSFEWVIYTFNMADKRTKENFLTNLKKTFQEKKSISEYFENMAQRAFDATK